MKISVFITIVVFLFGVKDCSAQNNRIQVSAPTIQQEASYIWRTINDIRFLKSQGYQINLPKHSLIDSLIEKSERGNFGNDDFPRIYSLLESGIYSDKAYQAAYNNVKDQQALINEMISAIDSEKDSWNWNFHMFSNYEVVFTLYGTGGSYDPDTGVITLLTNERGSFMGYEKPANTIIHEIVHMGVEKSLVQKYQLSHGMKERVVDTIVFILFQEELPDYRIQNMGNPEIDNHLKTKEDLKSLNDTLKALHSSK